MDDILPKISRYALTVEYDGSQFNGWQVQTGVPTVQGALEAALSRVADEPVRVTGAGRTDAGVHATGQIAHFDSSSPRSLRSWLKGANTFLPHGVSILSVLPVNCNFHARFSATGRAYRYVIFNRPVAPTFLRSRVTWEYRPIDVARMQAASVFLIGRHDFNAYRAVACQSESSIRDLRRLRVSTSGQWVWVDAEAGSFLQHMVRNIVGVLLAVGAGEKEPVWVREVLNSRDRTSGGVTAPPDGLYFVRASYPAPYQLPTVPECRFW
jgi:tRNA pseudouridine38-40 synthase